MANVLLIDDDIELTTLLVEYLSGEGLTADAVGNGRDGLARALSGDYEIVVLDIMMPYVNGIDVLQRLRRVTDVPVLMLTARGDDVDRIAGLNLGADDYVPKPCSPGELVARIRAILRRSKARAEMGENGDDEQVISGALTMTPRNRVVEWRGKRLELTSTEFNLLEVLVRSAGQVVSKQEISRKGLGRPLSPFDRRIDVHLSSIRQKLGLRDDGHQWIQTIRGQGYLLTQD